MISILSENKEYYYIPKDIMRIILSFLPNMNEVNANQWCTEENILYYNEKIKYGYLSFYLSLCNKDFTVHSCFDDEYFNCEYRMCGVKYEQFIQYDHRLIMDDDDNDLVIDPDNLEIDYYDSYDSQ